MTAYVVCVCPRIWHKLLDVFVEPECCDGSDEQPGVCPNVCAEVGKEYRKKMDAEMKLRKTVCTT